MWKPASPIVLCDEDLRLLEGWVRAPSTAQVVVMHSMVVLLSAEGLPNNAIAKKLAVTRPTVLLWRKRFMEGGPAALTEIAPGRGRPRRIDSQEVKRLVDATIQTKPKAATQWSCRTFARQEGISHSTVQRIWTAHGLQPHLTKSFKVSTDKQFLEKLTDVVGLYLNPPEKAVVLCFDEKTQIQALDRTQPGLPLKKGRKETMTHDYKRNGTTTLFAALNVLDGKVIGQCVPRHRNTEFLSFLRKLDRKFPKKLDLHLILDNYATHKHPAVKDWLAEHPRFHLHFTPTSSSWLNLVERWFREITVKRIRRGTFYSVDDLKTAIREYLEVNNENPKPFVWTASVEKIMAKISGCKAKLETLH